METLRKQPGNAGWTPRERVELAYRIAANSTLIPDALDMLQSLREVIRRQECRADSITSDWDWRVHR